MFQERQTDTERKRPLVATDGRRSLACCGALFCALVVALVSRSTMAASGTWTKNTAGNASGDWDTDTNWSSNNIADGVDSIANFGTLNITVNSTVTLNSTRTIGDLSFADTTTLSNNWTLLSTNGSVLTLQVTSGTPSITVTNQTASIGLVLDGTQGLSKLGAGMLVLSATNLFTGDISIGAGTLSIGSDAHLGDTSNGLVFAGGTLLTTADITLDSGRSVTMNSTGVLNVSTGTLTIGQAIGGAGGLTKSGAGTLILSGSNLYAGLTTVGTGTLSINSDEALGATTGDIALAGGTLLTTADIHSARNVILTGASTINVVTGTTLSLSGSLTSSGSLAKAGTGTLILSGSNSYGGATTLSAGTLQAGALGAFSASSAVTQSASTTLSLNGFSQTIGSLTGTGNIALGSATLTIGGAGATTYAGVISGSGSLVKNGAGTLALSGTNTYIGGTTISSGTLSINADVRLGDSNGDLQLLGGTLSTTGSFTLNAGRTVTLADGTWNTATNTTLTVAGAIGGAGTLTKNGAGTMVLANIDNDYSGGTTINAGTVAISSDSNLGDTSGGVTLAGGTLQTTDNITLAVGRVLTLGTGGGRFVTDPDTTLTVGQSITGTTTLTKVGTGTLQLTGTNALSGPVVVQEGTLQLTGANGSLQNVTAFTITRSQLQLDAGNANRLSDAASLSLTASTVKFGASETLGTVTLATGISTLHNSSTGTVTLGGLSQTVVGTVDFTSSAATLGTGSTAFMITGQSAGFIGGWATVEGGDFANYEITLGVQALGGSRPGLPTSGTVGHVEVTTSPAALVANTTIDSLLVSDLSNSTIDLGTNVLTITSGGLLRSGEASLTIANGSLTAGIGSATGLWAYINGGTTTISADLIDNGAGAVSLVKSGDGTLVLSGTGNNYSGGTYIHQGTLSIGSDAQLGATTGDLTLSGGTLAVTASMTLGAGRALSFNNGGTGTIDVASAVTLAIGQTVTNLVGNLTKTGTGTLQFSNTATVSGEIVINAGTLHVTGTTASLSGAARITVNEGARLMVSATGGSNGSVLDRLSNTMPITSNGGTLYFIQGGREDFGPVTLGRGTTTATMQKLSSNYSALSLSSVTRAADPSATILFNGILNSGAAGTLGAGVNNQPYIYVGGQAHGFIGGWAVTNLNDFAWYSTSGGFGLGGVNFRGVTSLSGAFGSGATVTSFNGVDEGADINASTATTLDGPRTVRSVRITGGVSSLGNNTLTISSGGLIGTGSLGTGTLTAGVDSVTDHAVLWVYSPGAFSLNAQIIDNPEAVGDAAALSLVKWGGSTLTLGNSTNAYSGGTYINQGLLRQGVAGALPSGTSLVISNTAGATLDLNGFDATVSDLSGGGSLGGTISLGTRTLSVNNSTDTTFAGTITGSGSLVKQGAGTLVLSHTGNTYTGLSIAAGTLSVSVESNLGATNSTVTLSGGTLRWTGDNHTLTSSHAFSTTSTSSAIEIVDELTTLTLNLNVTGSGGSLTKLGAGRLVLAGASNSYDGTTTVTAGTLHITNTLTSGGGVVAVETAGTLQSTSLTSILRNVTVTGNGTLSFAGGAIGGTLTATGGVWTGDGSVGGAITINPGTFTLSSGGTITASGLTTINSSGILNLGGTLSGSASLTGGTISGSGGTITGTLAVSGGAWSGTGTVNGAITATSGTFEVLNGATLNNLSTATVTGSATLSVNGALTGGMIVQSGGTLHGNGTIGGPVTINEGGFLSAGNSVGHLTVDDDLTWNSGSNQTFEISDADMLGSPGSDWDLITVNGELTLNATPSSKINLKFDSWPVGDPLDNFDALDNYSWLWITTTGGIDVSGQPVNDLFNITLGPEFAGDFPLVDPTKFNVSLSLDGLNMFVNYTVNVVPEPGTLLLASLAAAGLGVYGRRRSRAKYALLLESGPARAP